MEKKLKAASRSNEGWKNTAIKRAVWNDDADGHGGKLCFTGMRSVQIPDQITGNQWKSDPSGSMPDYLLKFTSTKKGEESDLLKLYSHHERFYPGENLIVENIDRMGAIFLTTPDGQSDLAFSVKGKHVFGFEESDDYILEDVALHENTQHVKDFAADQIKNELHPHTPPGSGRLIGEMVHYEKSLISATHIGNHKVEESRKPAYATSPIEIDLVPGQICMAA